MCQPVTLAPESVVLAEATTLKVSGTVALLVGLLTLTKTPAAEVAVMVSVWSPNAPVESQARTIIVCVPAVVVTLVLIELVGPGVPNLSTLSM
jgi:hypothetical protein